MFSPAGFEEPGTAETIDGIAEEFIVEAAIEGRGRPLETRLSTADGACLFIPENGRRAEACELRAAAIRKLEKCMIGIDYSLPSLNTTRGYCAGQEKTEIED